jgi:hypothetical protein
MQSLTIDLPETVIALLKQCADHTQRTVQEVAREVISANVPLEPGISPMLAEELARMPQMSDAELWQAARMRVSSDDSDRLEELHYEKMNGGLSEEERDEQRRLLAVCDRVMLIRAQAAVLLKQRGHDISVLLKP